MPSPYESFGGHDPPRPSPSARVTRALRDLVDFARDLGWLIGWGARATVGASTDPAMPSEESRRWVQRGCVGCLASALMLAIAGGYWRRARRPRRR